MGPEYWDIFVQTDSCPLDVGLLLQQFAVLDPGAPAIVRVEDHDSLNFGGDYAIAYGKRSKFTIVRNSGRCLIPEMSDYGVYIMVTSTDMETEREDARGMAQCLERAGFAVVIDSLSA